MRPRSAAGVVLLVAAILGSTPSVAFAQTVCGPRTAVLERLKSLYDEVPVSVGLGNDGGVVEVVASRAGTFSIVVTRPDGLSCLLATGRDWEPLQAPLAGT